VAIQLVQLDAASTGMDLLKNIALDGKNVRSAKEAGWLTACVPPLLPPRARAPQSRLPRCCWPRVWEGGSGFLAGEVLAPWQEALC
jgi:hypothetical protein